MRILHTAPVQDGFFMPAEFAPHEGCLMIWPERADSWQYGAYAARKAFLRVIETISESEKMTVLCSEGQYDNARAQLPPQVRLVVMETDDADELYKVATVCCVWAAKTSRASPPVLLSLMLQALPRLGRHASGLPCKPCG